MVLPPHNLKKMATKQNQIKKSKPPYQKIKNSFLNSKKVWHLGFSQFSHTSCLLRVFLSKDKISQQIDSFKEALSAPYSGFGTRIQTLWGVMEELYYNFLSDCFITIQGKFRHLGNYQICWRRINPIHRTHIDPWISPDIRD